MGAGRVTWRMVRDLAQSAGYGMVRARQVAHGFGVSVFPSKHIVLVDRELTADEAWDHVRAALQSALNG